MEEKMINEVPETEKDYILEVEGLKQYFPVEIGRAHV